MFSTRPVIRLSIATTSCPFPINKSLRWLPKNPAPPVIRMRMGPYSFFNSFLSLSADRNEAYSRRNYSSRQPIYIREHHIGVPLYSCLGDRHNTVIAARNDYKPVWANAQ